MANPSDQNPARLFQGITVAITDEVCAALNMSRGGVYAAARRGEIPTTRIGGKVLILAGPMRRMLGLDEPAKTQVAA